MVWLASVRTMSQIKVAIAHDYLTQRGGAERVTLALARAFPEAPIYTTLYDPDLTYPEFRKHDVRVSWLNRLSFLRRFHRVALPLLAIAVGTTRIDAKYAIVSSSGWAHGYRTSGTKIVYCHSPARWLYQPDLYLGPQRITFKRIALKSMSPFLKRWDKRQALTATKYFSNSSAVQQRICDTYGIRAEVLPAPHSIDTDLRQEAVDLSALKYAPDGFYLCISRLLPYKNVDVIIEALRPLGVALVVVGNGPEEKRLQSIAGSSVLMMKDLPDAKLHWLYHNCTALVAASYEDYGLTPIEAAVFGKPAVALRWGGFLDTIREGETGVYFDEPTPECLRAAVIESKLRVWDADLIKAHGKRFSEPHFAARLREEIGE